MQKVVLVLEENRVIDGQLYLAGTQLLTAELREGISLSRVKLLLATDRAKWEEDVEGAGASRRGRKRAEE